MKKIFAVLPLLALSCTALAQTPAAGTSTSAPAVTGIPKGYVKADPEMLMRDLPGATVFLVKAPIAIREDATYVYMDSAAKCYLSTVAAKPHLRHLPAGRILMTYPRASNDYGSTFAFTGSDVDGNGKKRDRTIASLYCDTSFGPRPNGDVRAEFSKAGHDFEIYIPIGESASIEDSGESLSSDQNI